MMPVTSIKSHQVYDGFFQLAQARPFTPAHTAAFHEGNCLSKFCLHPIHSTSVLLLDHTNDLPFPASVAQSICKMSVTLCRVLSPVQHAAHLPRGRASRGWSSQQQKIPQTASQAASQMPHLIPTRQSLRRDRSRCRRLCGDPITTMAARHKVLSIVRSARRRCRAESTRRRQQNTESERLIS